MCPKHIPSSHYAPHSRRPSQPHKHTSSFTCSQIYFSLSSLLLLLVSPLPSLPSCLSLAAALLAQWQSHHTLSIRLARGPGAVQHRIAQSKSGPISASQSPLTPSVTLKKARAARYSPFPSAAPIALPQPIAGQEMGRMQLESRFSWALDLITFDKSLLP